MSGKLKKGKSGKTRHRIETRAAVLGSRKGKRDARAAKAWQPQKGQR